NIIKALEIDSEKINYWELYAKINCDLKQYEEVETAFKEILSLGELDINIFATLTKILLEIPLNNSLSNNLLKSINLFQKSAESEINYLLSAIYYKNSDNIKALEFLKKAYFYNPSKYSFYKNTFKLIPNLQVFKNTLVN
ncbi:MAG: hypothetical protein HN599_01970, partial [Flavobacteriaceae bacterium]|nr:hypothetical protein [Flavobacteriaceae bacterium]